MILLCSLDLGGLRWCMVLVGASPTQDVSDTSIAAVSVGAIMKRRLSDTVSQDAASRSQPNPATHARDRG